MNGTVLHDNKRLVGNSGAVPGAVAGDPAGVVRPTPGLPHGLVAIANGPDYCLCGETWPCAPTRAAR
jgi:hypothetical protein